MAHAESIRGAGCDSGLHSAGVFRECPPLWSKQDTGLKQQEGFLCMAYISGREEKGKKWVSSLLNLFKLVIRVESSKMHWVFCGKHFISKTLPPVLALLLFFPLMMFPFAWSDSVTWMNNAHIFRAKVKTEWAVKQEWKQCFWIKSSIMSSS